MRRHGSSVGDLFDANFCGDGFLGFHFAADHEPDNSGGSCCKPLKKTPATRRIRRPLQIFSSIFRAKGGLLTNDDFKGMSHGCSSIALSSDPAFGRQIHARLTESDIKTRKMTCLVLGDIDDEHAVHMQNFLRGRGQDVELLDTRWFPTTATLALDPLTFQGTLGLPNGRRLRLAAIRSVYWRCYNGVAAPDLPNAEQSFIAANDTRSLVESLLIRLPARWVNGWQGFQLHQTKAAALSLVAELGVSVPATICTNDPEAVREFAARFPRAIFKPVQGGAHARRLTSAHLDEPHLANLQVAPVALQEEIQGVSVRVFVAGNQVFGCELLTHELDYRDSDEVRIRPCELALDFQKQCIQIARRLHLLWTGMDFIRTPDGRFVFLEANPSPMFLGFERETHLPLTESLGALLIEEFSPA
jgi:hypothetical protein